VFFLLRKKRQEFIEMTKLEQLPWIFSLN